MTKKKDPNVLGLAPLGSDLSTASASLVPWRARRAQTAAEKQLTDEERRQLLIIDIMAVKERFGLTKIVQIHQHGSQAFDEATSTIIEIKDQPRRSQQHQAYIDAFSERQIQLLAQHSLSLIDLGSTNIGAVVHRSPEPPPKPLPPPPPKRHIGLLERIFGTWE